MSTKEHTNLKHVKNLKNVVPYLVEKEIRNHFPLKWSGRDGNTVQSVLKAMDAQCATMSGMKLLQHVATEFGLGGNLNRLAMAATGRPNKKQVLRWGLYGKSWIGSLRNCACVQCDRIIIWRN